MSWADYSGVSRTLSQLSQTEADQTDQILEQITQPIQAEEVMLALKETGHLAYDGDLTDQPVSNTSTTYPGVAYGRFGSRLQNTRTILFLVPRSKRRFRRKLWARLRLFCRIKVVC